MAFNFSILFSGICAFVPSPDGSFDDPNHQIDSVSVVIPNLFRSKASEGGGRREPHIPILEVASDQGWTGREPDLVAPSTVAGRKRELHALKGQRISFKIAGPNSSPDGIKVLNFQNPPPPGQTEPDPARPEENNFFWWVPKMEKVVPGSERIRADLLKASAEEDAATSAVVKLAQGQLSVPNGGLSPRVMEFKKIQGATIALRQKIAARIALDVKTVDSVEITFQNEAGEKTTLKLEGAQGDVSIQIQHLEVDNLFGRRSPRNSTLPEIDFETYYELSSANVLGRLVPHALPDQGSTALGLTLGGVCPPTAFSGTAAVAPAAVAPAVMAPAAVAPAAVAPAAVAPAPLSAAQRKKPSKSKTTRRALAARPKAAKRVRTR